MRTIESTNVIASIGCQLQNRVFTQAKRRGATNGLGKARKAPSTQASAEGFARRIPELAGTQSWRRDRCHGSEAAAAIALR